MPLLRTINNLIRMPVRLWRHSSGKAAYLLALALAALTAG